MDNQRTEKAKGPGIVLARPGVRIGLLALVVVGTAAYLLFGWLGRRSAVQKASAEWAAYGRCLLGDEPLAKDERPVIRMRRIEVSLPEASPPKGADGKPLEWPDRCQGHLQAIHAALVDTRLDADGRYAHFDRLVQTAAQPHASLVPQYLDDRVIVDELWEAAHDTDLITAQPQAGEVPAPPAAKPLEVWKLEPLASVAGDLLPRTDPVPGAVLHMLWPNEGGISYACTFGRQGADVLASVQCKGLGIGRRWTNLATFATLDDDFAGMVVADSLPSAGLFAGDTGRMIVPDLDESSFVARDGAIVGLRSRGTRTLLTRLAPGGVAADTPLPGLARPQDDYRLRADALVATAPGGDTARLLARRVTASDAVPAPTDVGPVADDVNAVRACRTNEALAVVLKSPGAAKDVRITVAFRAGDTWSPPVEGKTSWATPELGASWGSSVLTCRGREATLTWQANDEVHQVRCSPQSCQSATSGPLGLPGASVGIEAADLDGKVILTRVVKVPTPLSGSTLSVRMRIAPVTELAKAPDVVVLGDEKHEGMALNGSVNLYVRRNAAVILVRDDKVLRGVRVMPDGKFAGLKLEGAR